MKNRAPVPGPLTRACIAVGKVRKRRRWLESQDCLRLAGAIGPVASDTGSLEDLFARIELQAFSRCQLRRRRLCLP